MGADTTPNKRTASIARKVTRVFLKIVIGVLALFILIILLVQTPPVQNFARKKIVAFLENKLQTKVQIGRIYLGIPNKVRLENIYLEDRQKDTLLSGGRIRVDLDLFALMSNHVQINELELEEITAKVKRVLPDTVFNFQFIVDAFMPKKQTTTPADTAAFTMNIDQVRLDKIRIVYNDVIAGSEMDLWLQHFESNIKTFDPIKFNFDVPLTRIQGLKANIYQRKPLVVPEPLSKDLAEAVQPIPFQLGFEKIELSDIDLNYGNDVSAVYTKLNLGELLVNANNIDFEKRIIHLDELQLNKTVSAIRFGKKEAAKVVAKEIAKEVEIEAQNNWRIVVDKMRLNENTIQFDNDNMPRQRYGMDYAHLKMDQITLHADDFLFTLDSISGNIVKGQFREQSGFQLNTLQTNFLYASNQAYLENLLIETPGTSIRRHIALRYPSLEALQKNIALLQLDADLPNARIQVKDILTFAPQLRNQPAFAKPNAFWLLDTRIRGSVERMVIEKFRFQGMQNTRADLHGVIAGLPDINKMNASLSINTLRTSRSDLNLFIPPGTLPKNITLPETINLNGKVVGGVARLATNLNVHTNLGSASVNGTMQNLMNPKQVQYNTRISTTNLNLGRILQNEKSFGTLTANFVAAGKGFDPKTANAKINGTIQSAVLNKYNYRNADITATVAQQMVNADLSIIDPNIHLTLHATSDISGEFPSVVLAADLDSIKTLPLNFSTEPIMLRGKITGNFATTDPARLTGNLLITQLLIATKDQRVQLDTISLLAGKNDSGQFMRMNSDAVNVHMYGQYNLAQLGTVFQQAIQPYFAVIPEYKTVQIDPYDFKFTATVINRPSLKAFLPELKTLEPVSIQGWFNTTGWEATANSPLVIYGVNEIDNLNFKAGTSQNSINVQASIKKFTSGNAMHLYATNVTATVANNTIDFRLNIKDKTAKDKYIMSGLLSQLQQGNYSFSLKPADLLLNYDAWTASNDNAIRFGASGINVRNFVLDKNTQQLSINSKSDANNAPLDIRFANFQLSTVTGFVQHDSLMVNGVVNGLAELSNFTEKQPLFTTDLTINDLSIYKDTLGNARIQVNNQGENTLAADVTLTGRGNDINLRGSYYTEPRNNNMFDLVLDIRKLELNTIEGATRGALTNASGSINGKFAVKGKIEDPDINGNLNFNNAAFTVVPLNSYYFIVDQQTIVVNDKGILFDSFTIKDSLHNNAIVDGGMYTTNFANYNLDLKINTDNFRALNTVKRQNQLYYGQIYFSSNLSIRGTETQPIIDGTVKINDKTKFTIVLPQNEPGIVDREGIVRFVDMDAIENDSIWRAYDTLNNSNILGLDIAMNIEVDRNAEFTLIIDEGAGDFVRVKGEALLTGGIDKSGKITLTGSYEIDEGEYELTFNFLRRKFSIQKGSKIVWQGEPTNADVNVTAIYIANTSPLTLVESQLATATTTMKNTYRQKLPFEVHLKMNGELLKPNITFDVLLPEGRNYMVSREIIENVDLRLQQLRTEPSELNKQVFALLLLNRFVSENPFASSGDGGGLNAERFARQSASKLLTEQLNQLAESLIEGVDINFDVVSTEDYTTGEFRNRSDLNVSLSKRFLDDRLKVTVGSNFELEGPKTAGNSSPGIGNVALDYKLSNDGRYMLRAYRKNEYQGALEGYIIETGLNFIITLDYNRFKEILQRKKKKSEVKKDAASAEEKKIDVTPGGSSN